MTTGELEDRIDEFVQMGTERRVNMDLGFKYLEVSLDPHRSTKSTKQVDVCMNDVFDPET